MDGTENAAVIVETHVQCQQYAFVAPEEVMFRTNPVFENSYRWNSSSDSNESYLAVSLVVSFRGGEIDGSSESISLSVDGVCKRSTASSRDDAKCAVWSIVLFAEYERVE